MNSRLSLVLAIAVFWSIWLFILPSILSQNISDTFSSDASIYNAGGIHLADSFFYSLDGERVYTEREPGMSMFLGIIYIFFGAENRVAFFLIQAILHLIATFLFYRTIRLSGYPNIALGSSLFLLFLPTIFHVLYSANRESLTLSLLLLFITAVIWFIQRPTLLCICLVSMLMAIVILTYLPLVLLPLFLLPFLWYVGFRLRYLTIFILLSYFLVSLWGWRNFAYTGEWQLAGSFRTTAMIYARAEQAEHLRGLEPLRCLYAEYISRDWSSRSHACSFNYLVNSKWPGRVPTAGDELIKERSIEKILTYFPYYIWFSVFEALEYHLPFVNGWGKTYNMLTTLGMALLYIGCVFSVFTLRRVYKEPWFVITCGVALYNFFLFILTDATPRYHVPVLFFYAVLSALGYTWLYRQLPLRPRPTPANAAIR